MVLLRAMREKFEFLVWGGDALTHNLNSETLSSTIILTLAKKLPR
jgi:hypothetical protein